MIGVIASYRFYYAIWPLVQSLPELLHHQKEVVSMIESYVQKGQPATLPSFLQLISVLGRYYNFLYPSIHLLLLQSEIINDKGPSVLQYKKGFTRGLVSPLPPVVQYACQAS